MKAKSYTVKEFEKILKLNGFERVRTHGSHAIYKKEDKTISVVVNNSSGMNRMICRRLIKENGLIV